MWSTSHLHDSCILIPESQEKANTPSPTAYYGGSLRGEEIFGKEGRRSQVRAGAKEGRAGEEGEEQEVRADLENLKIAQ